MMVIYPYSQLRRDEGEKLYAYKDSLGFLTIGVGILIDERRGGGLRPEESEFIFRNRLKVIEKELTERAPWVHSLDAARKGVLLNMAYQLGVPGLMVFKKTLGLIREKKYEEASKEMLDSLWARQTPNRAKRLSRQMATGVWQ